MAGGVASLGPLYQQRVHVPPTTFDRKHPRAAQSSWKADGVWPAIVPLNRALASVTLRPASFTASLFQGIQTIRRSISSFHDCCGQTRPHQKVPLNQDPPQLPFGFFD
ncbi:hypothetical protein CC2G_012796 [Coprinopsis cinerea AmutBmut pab1-1]|nr:hypothetical protein CC2G_012796 [Coprinopsis cinerea AmutBmut pab1-1]